MKDNRKLSDLMLSKEAKDLDAMFKRFLIYYAQTSICFPQNDDMWYVEQTLTTLVVAAAWTCGHPAISEVKSRRVRLSGNSGGRIDAILSLNTGLTAIESKIKWFNNKNGFEGVIGNLEEAEENCRSIEPSFIGRRLALSYGMLERGEGDAKDLLFSLVARCETMNLDVLLWTVNSRPTANVRFPGCLTVGRFV